ncbi:uncharacterized protein LOC110858453 [Folsomia candida]|uniref:Uncharacterized protein n=1 Tax=Folsomia candida TaxID=158441 RepID=A0A226DF35_FOLCA|nr:uncharacterized protein LOC110858453 [Folsomia candida]XP_035714730.1 uncharacterized protein LOC110858453 [Folsomia candida]OXA43779.1 hypothetical protein Fcan01_21521 [Folsomia candida]
MKAIILLVALGLVASTYASGAKTFGDSCNFIASGIQIFSDNNYAEACDTEKSLICAINKCDCVPGFRWEQNFFEKLAGVGGACIRELNGSASGISAFGGIFATLIATLVVRQAIY